MIDPNWSVVDLDPRTWRNLGRFFEVERYLRTAEPNEHALFVLHDEGQPLKVHDSQSGSRPELVSGPIENPQLLAHDLFESGEWDRVHVINKQHLVEVARQAQQIENRALTLDAYYHRIFELVWGQPQGYVSLPPHPGHWNHWTYSGIKNLLTHLPDPASAVLGVVEQGEIVIGLILECRGGLIRTVTTFEALALSQPVEVSADGLRRLCDSVEAKFKPVGAALVCDEATFEAWIAAADKLACLRAAGQRQKAFWRLQLNSR